MKLKRAGAILLWAEYNYLVFMCKVQYAETTF